MARPTQQCDIDADSNNDNNSNPNIDFKHRGTITQQPFGSGVQLLSVCTEMSFSFVNCIACDRQWSQEDRKGKDWWPLRDQEIQRWCCYRCINRAWRNSRPAANVGPCPPTIAEALQTDEFQIEIRYLLAQHKKDYGISGTQPMNLD